MFSRWPSFGLLFDLICLTIFADDKNRRRAGINYSIVAALQLMHGHVLIMINVDAVSIVKSSHKCHDSPQESKSIH